MDVLIEDIKRHLVQAPDDDHWTLWFPSEEAAMEWRAIVRKEPGCEHADFRNDPHYDWPGKTQAGA